MSAVQPSPRADRVIELEAELATLRQEYELAKARRLNAFAAWAIVDRVVDTLEAYIATDGGDKAIYLLGTLRGMLTVERSDRALISKVEALRDRRQKLQRPGN